MKIPKLGAIHDKILDLLRSNPDGLTIYQIRDGIPGIGTQQHLDKRVRDLRYFHEVPIRKGRYFYEGEKVNPASDIGRISAKDRAAVLNKAHGRCQMCGRTVQEDEIKLQVDHKIPRTWGGETVLDNLWALCQLCNGGKRDFFATFNDKDMKEIATLDSVYQRIAAVLKMHEGKPVPAWLLEFVANIDDFQEDWQKRLRELRYPIIGMKITATRAKTPSGKWQAAYVLEEWKPLPPDHKFKIKEFERQNRKGKAAESEN